MPLGNTAPFEAMSSTVPCRFNFPEDYPRPHDTELKPPAPAYSTYYPRPSTLSTTTTTSIPLFPTQNCLVSQASSNHSVHDIVTASRLDGAADVLC